MKAWFVSDLHLESLNERNGNILLRFLLSLEKKERSATHLFFLGDIFDFWAGDHPYYEEKYQAFIESVMRLKEQGLQLFYIEGNHDLHLQKFWRKKGVASFVEDRYLDLGPWKIRVSHGDLINPHDLDYQKFRSLVRNGIVSKLAEILPPKQLFDFGDWLSRVSRKKSTQRRRDQKEDLRQMIRDYAERSYAEGPFDWIISGHMHVKDEWSTVIDGREIKSVNLGSWFEQPTAFWLDDKGSGWETLS